MSKTKEATEVKEAKKLNKLEIKKETITDLNVPDTEQVKGGTAPSPGGGGGSGRYTCVPCYVYINGNK